MFNIIVEFSTFLRMAERSSSVQLETVRCNRMRCKQRKWENENDSNKENRRNSKLSNGDNGSISSVSYRNNNDINDRNNNDINDRNNNDKSNNNRNGNKNSANVDLIENVRNIMRCKRCRLSA
jgi:hypothetical protein